MFITTNIVQFLPYISTSVETAKETISKGTVAELTKGTEFNMDIYYWLRSVDKRNITDEIELIDENGRRNPFCFKNSFYLNKDTVVMINDKPYRIENNIINIFLNDVKFTCSALGSRLYVKNNLEDKYNQAAYELMSKTDKYHVHAIDNKYTITQIHNYAIPTLKYNAFYSALELNEKHLEQITTNTPSMFLYSRKSWGCFEFDRYHG